MKHSTSRWGGTRTPIRGREVVAWCTHGLLALCLLTTAADAQLAGLTGGSARRAATPPAFPSSETWTFDESTSGADIVWVSPTAVDPTAPGYLVQFTVQTIEVDVSFIGIPFGAFDVTDQVPDELLQSGETLAGPAPINLLNLVVMAPPPPDPLALGATLSMGLSDAGFAQLLANNIVLGTTVVDLGGIFGTVTVDITGFRIVGSVTVTPLKWRLLPL